VRSSRGLGAIERGAKGSEGGAIGSSVRYEGTVSGRGANNLGVCAIERYAFTVRTSIVGGCVGTASILGFL